MKSNITGEQVRSIAAKHNVTLAKCAVLTGTSYRTFQRWIAERPPIPQAAWELLNIKLAALDTEQ